MFHVSPLLGSRVQYRKHENPCHHTEYIVKGERDNKYNKAGGHSAILNKAGKVKPSKEEKKMLTKGVLDHSWSVRFKREGQSKILECRHAPGV